MVEPPAGGAVRRRVKSIAKVKLLNDFFGDLNRTLDRYLTPAVKTIFLTNVVIHLMFIFGGVIDRGAADQVVDFLGQIPGKSFYQPWRFLTYMFIHANIWHLVFNMMVLFFFGPPLEGRWGKNGFWRFYLIVGIGAVGSSIASSPTSTPICLSAMPLSDWMP